MLERGIEQEDLLGFPHPEVAAGQGEPPPLPQRVLDVPHVGAQLLLQFNFSPRQKNTGKAYRRRFSIKIEFLSFSVTVTCNCTFLA